MFQMKLYLEFGNHASLRVIRYGQMLNKAFGEHLAVEFLKNVLIVEVLEDDHLEICNQQNGNNNID